MPIGDYCRGDPVTATAEESIQEAAKRMDACGVGCLVVVDGENRPIGMVTDRDLALRVLRRGIDPGSTPLETLMHTPVVTVSESAPVAVAVRFMRQNGLRRVPVVDGRTGVMSGIISSDDLLQLVASELTACAEVARQQFPAEQAPSPGGQA